MLELRTQMMAIQTNPREGTGVYARLVGKAETHSLNWRVVDVHLGHGDTNRRIDGANPSL